MKRLSFYFFFAVTCLSINSSYAATQKFVLREIETGLEKKFSWKGQALLSCPETQKNCLADQIKGKFKSDQLKYQASGGNPTERLCKLVDGKTAIHKDASESEFLICQLKDGSAILSWSLVAQ